MDMSKSAGLFSSATDLWSTPQDFFDSMNRRFGGFDIDVCSNGQNAKAPIFFTREDDGLKQSWSGKCWMNPPYGREIGKWVEKAWKSSRYGATVVCLLPARTDTRWWHDRCMKASEMLFVKGRLKFGGAKEPAPFPNAVIVFDSRSGHVNLQIGALTQAGDEIYSRTDQSMVA